jgi:hypothetical protein
MFLEIVYTLLQIIGWGAMVAGLGIVSTWVSYTLVDWVERWRQNRRAEIEAVLDRKQAELRQTVLHLAEALAEERIAANETAAQMIRAAYLTRGQLPQR